MKTIGIFYATREGHTRQIARHAASVVRSAGFDADVRDVRDPVSGLHQYEAIVAAASVHVGKHEPEMVKFVRTHRNELEAMHSALISVTLSQAGVERSGTTPEDRARFEAGVRVTLEAFYRDTGWHPKIVKPVAGALLYSKYNFFLRHIMKWIARKSGASTDTSHDHVYTDWAALDRFLEGFVAGIRHATEATA